MKTKKTEIDDNVKQNKKSFFLSNDSFVTNTSDQSSFIYSMITNDIYSNEHVANGKFAYQVRLGEID